MSGTLAEAIAATKAAVARGERFDPGPVKMLRDGDAYFSTTYGYPPVKGRCVEIDAFTAPKKPIADWDRDALSDDVKRARSASHQSAIVLGRGAFGQPEAYMRVPRAAIYSLAAAYAQEVAGYDPVKFLLVDTGEMMYYAPSEGPIEEGWFVQ